jgi:uncharacterized protein
MRTSVANPFVHLELRSPDRARACAFYAELLGWRASGVRGEHESYLALAMSDVISGGVVEAEAGSSWLPYAEISDIEEATAHAERLGAAVILEPREGPAGWRSVVGVPAGAEVALWQPKL